MKKAILLSLLLLLPIGVKADQTSESGAGEKIYQLEPVIVTATRYPEHLKNVPSYATLLASSRLRNFNLLSLGEALKNFSGGEMKFAGELGQVQTFGLRGSSSSQVLFLLEGRKLNYTGNGIFNLSDFPLENLEKVEIVHGPLSSLYGANALGGVVNLIPSLPTTSRRKVSSFFSFRRKCQPDFIPEFQLRDKRFKVRFRSGKKTYYGPKGKLCLFRPVFPLDPFLPDFL